MIITTYDTNQNPKTIMATKWFKNGDHPDDDSNHFTREGKIVRYYRHPDINGKSICPFCEKTMHEHGWIDGSDNAGYPFVVCPGNYIIQDEELYYACDSLLFDLMYIHRNTGENNESKYPRI